VKPSLQAFLAGLIDYAGLFPPAQLLLPEAFRNYLHYQREPDAFMLGRFVCPAARLKDLGDLRKDAPDAGASLPLSVLGRGGENCSEFLQGLEADVEAISASQEAQGQRAAVEVLELRLPKEAFDGPADDRLRDLLRDAAALLRSVAGRAVFWEAPPGAGRRARAVSLIAVLGKLRDASIAGAAVTGFKLRCGGADAAAVPSIEEVAEALAACRDMGVPFKATAGLHHPVRYFDKRLGCSAHGFLNVFGAGVLAHALGLDADRLRDVVASESPTDFAFDDHGFRWRDLRASTEQVAAARRNFALSFGSCSFDEPRDDLRRLSLL
jgi:hypothetical protein